MEIVRLKGRIDQNMIPIIEARIKDNRSHGSKIDRNVVLDFSKVEHVDSALVASHLIRLKEYQEKGYEIGLINVTEELRALLDIFKEGKAFRIFSSEDEAVKELNR